MNPAPVLTNDLYQFTMSQVYLAGGIAGRRSVFELFFRKAPHGGTYAIACGIENALDFIEQLRIGTEEIEYLRSTGIFNEKLLSSLAELRFSGDVDAVPEGTVVFSREPLLRVSAPLFEAQLLETPLLNLVGFATLVATKAARICAAAAPAEVVEFGCRRAQGPNGALTASLAAFIGGCTSTSNLEAGRRFGIPVKGTMAHSLVMAYPSEIEAFRAFTGEFPGLSILLIDTINTLQSGLPNAIEVARDLQKKGKRLLGVRLDSGDLVELSKQVRLELDRAGLREVKIFASGDLDEQRISSLVSAGAQIDAYGVGTRLASCDGDSALTCIYKLVAIEESSGSLEAKMKKTDDPEKATLAGIKQVYRFIDKNGKAVCDVLALDSQEDLPQRWLPELLANLPEGGKSSNCRTLLEPVFRKGTRLKPRENLNDIRERARISLESIPNVYKKINQPNIYPVSQSPGLTKLHEGLKER